MYNRNTYIMQLCDHLKKKCSEHGPDDSNDTSFLFDCM